MFDVDVWFGVSILIYDDFKSILICLTAWKIFGVMIKIPFVHLMVAVRSRRFIVAKMMTCLCAIFIVHSSVTAANFRVTGVD